MTQHMRADSLCLQCKGENTEILCWQLWQVKIWADSTVSVWLKNLLICIKTSSAWFSIVFYNENVAEWVSNNDTVKWVSSVYYSMTLWQRDYNIYAAYSRKHYRLHMHKTNVEEKKTISLLFNQLLSHTLLHCLMRSLTLSSQCTAAHRVQCTLNNSEIDECWEHRECEQCSSVRQ